MQKQNLTINFNGDLDTKTDPFQVAPNNFLSFQNAVRSTAGQFKKRNAFDIITSTSTPYPTTLATFGGSLVEVGSTIDVFSPDISQNVSRGTFQPVSLSVIPAIRTSNNIESVDVAIAPNNIACVVSTDSSLGVIYQIVDATSGAVIAPIAQIGLGTGQSNAANPKVYLLGTNFIITFTITVSGSQFLSYLPIPWATPTSAGSVTTIANTGISSTPYDGFVSGGILYIAWRSSDNGGASFRIASITSNLIISSSTLQDTLSFYNISVTVDSSNLAQIRIWVTTVSYNIGTGVTEVKTSAFTPALVVALADVTLYGTALNPGTNITTVATAGVLTYYFDSQITYPDSNFTDIILSGKCTIIGGVTAASQFILGVGIASRAFINPINNTIYFLSYYQGNYQPTYFLIDGNANVLAKLAYSNGAQPGLGTISSVNQVGSTLQIGYLYRDQISAINKTTGTTNVGGFYYQAGANIATFTLGVANTATTEIGGSLELSGGFPWMFDGQKPVELGFHLFPEDLSTTVSMTTGSISQQQYYYQGCYEWTDNAGNIHRSAPSVPVGANVTNSMGTASIEVVFPCLRLTGKTLPNGVRLVLYRWSTTNPIYYQVTSVSSPTINDPTQTYLTITDSLDDSSIIGNNIIYTNGGVIENIAGPATGIMTLFDTRLWMVDSEDPNLLWFSKQVIESTPVEMSDLLTFYVAPTTGATGSTGPTTALSALDDKLIIFKQNAIYFINGTGGDITGANNQYSQPIFITATVGCSNPQSIVLMQNGIMFQSNQGIWLLGRDLSTNYIGAQVEAYNSDTVTSSLSIPATTQVRFTLNTGTELVYDYYYQKWDTCVPPTAISSVLYQGLHTLLDASGNVWQENVGNYVENGTSVNMSFETPWYNLAGIQGYERMYSFYLLGTYLSPHVLNIQIYQDYDNSTPSQTLVIRPTNAVTGSTLEQWRVPFTKQKCQSVRFIVSEAYDPTIGPAAGAGLTLSGINLVLGIKKGYRPISAANTNGAGQ